MPELAIGAFAAVFEKTTAALAVIDLDGPYILRVNRACGRLIGHEPQEVIGRTPVELGLITPEAAVELRARLVDQVERTGMIEEVEIDILTSSGERKTVAVTAERLELDGRGPCVLATYFDVTARRQAEYRLETVIGALAEGVITTDEQGQILSANPAARQLLGLVRNTVMPHSMAQLAELIELRTAVGERLPLERWPHARILRGEAIELELEMVRGGSDGRSMQRVLGFTGRLVGQPDGSLMAVLAITDLTARAAAQSALCVLNDELEQRVAERTEQLAATNSDLEAFSYSISHDLRAPLRAINGFAEILVDEHARELSPAAAQLLAKVRDSGLRMRAMIDDLLAFSRLGRAGLRRQRIDTQAMVRSIVEELGPRPALELTIGELPAAMGDPTLIRQVWTNLIENAIKYSRGRTPACVEITGELAAGEAVVFHVRDNGVGFDPAGSERLFGVFQRLHRASEFEGTGVGLAIVKKITERHGGKVWAESVPGAGSSFHFTLAGAP